MDSVYHDLVCLVRSNPSLFLLMPLNIPDLGKLSPKVVKRVHRSKSVRNSPAVYPAMIQSILYLFSTTLVAIAQRPDTLLLPLEPRVVKIVPGSMRWT